MLLLLILLLFCSFLSLPSVEVKLLIFYYACCFCNCLFDRYVFGGVSFTIVKILLIFTGYYDQSVKDGNHQFDALLSVRT